MTGQSSERQGNDSDAVMKRTLRKAMLLHVNDIALKVALVESQRTCKYCYMISEIAFHGDWINISQCYIDSPV